MGAEPAPLRPALGRSGRPRAFHAIVDQIRDDIFEGRLKPGDRIGREDDLGAQFGVSRTAVREALRVLELQGLVRVQHGYGGGAFIGEPGPVPVLGALQTSLQLAQVTVDELYHARVLFEPVIARLAVERDDGNLADRLADNITRTEMLLGARPKTGLSAELLGEREKAFGANLEFHAILARAAGNAVVGLVMQALLELLDRLDRDYPTNASISHAAVADHQQILEAVRGGQATWVEALMTSHLVRLEGRFSELQAHLQRERGGVQPIR